MKDGVVFPRHMQDVKTITICEKDGFKLEVTPSWPCFKKDGAGSVTHFWFKITYKDEAGNVFEIKQPEECE